MWIYIGKLCESCGGEIHVKVFENKPSDEEIETFKRTSQIYDYSCLQEYTEELDDMNECSLIPD